MINCCDSREGMKEIPDNSIPLTVTSPPFGSLRDFGHDVPYTWEVFTGVAQELARVTKQGGVICWAVQNEIVNQQEILQSEREKLYFCDQLGLIPHQTIIATMEAGCYPQKNRYASSLTQNIYVLSKGLPETVNILCDQPNKTAGQYTAVRIMRTKYNSYRSEQAGYCKTPELRNRSNVWTFSGGAHCSSDRISSGHSARMHENLAGDLILSFSNEGDTVLDPFCGAGTTPKMAWLNHRKHIGFELNPEYVEIAEKRLEDAKRQKEHDLCCQLAKIRGEEPDEM